MVPLLLAQPPEVLLEAYQKMLAGSPGSGGNGNGRPPEVLAESYRKMLASGGKGNGTVTVKGEADE